MGIAALLGFLALFLFGWFALVLAIVLFVIFIKIAFVVAIAWVVWKILDAIF